MGRHCALLFLASITWLSVGSLAAHGQQLLSTAFTSPSVFAFGASMIDSGENAIAMPLRSYAEFAPYGMDYFEKPMGRWSNGRTFLDLIMEGLHYDQHLAPYLKSTDANFTFGVNFASSGSTAQNSTAKGGNSGGLFCLLVQVDQFRAFQATVISSQHGVKATLRMEQQFSEAIYFFETGSNDYTEYAFTSDYDPLAAVLATVASMRQAFEVLYGAGARTFIVMNVTPLGCTPATLSSNRGNGSRDAYGCKADWMELANLHNEHLANVLEDLRVDLPEGEWILFDAYSIFLDAYRNPSTYGIAFPFQACCGAGGEFNVNWEVICGESPKYVNGTYVEWTKCDDPKLHLIWDFIHPTESFGYYIAQGVLNGTHLSPSFDIMARVQSIRMAKALMR